MKIRFNTFKKCLISSLLLGMLVLQGCSIKDAQTTIKVTQSDDKRKVQVELKADTSQNYEWVYFTQNNLITESNLPESTNDQFSTTFITKYRFSAHDEGEDTMYFVLIKDGDLEKAKAYAYEMSVNDEAKIKMSDVTEMTVGLYPDILKKLEETVKK